MSEFLPSSLALLGDGPSKSGAAEPQTPAWGSDKPKTEPEEEEAEGMAAEEGGEAEEEEEEEEMVSSASLEPTTLQWPGDRGPPEKDRDGGGPPLTDDGEAREGGAAEKKREDGAAAAAGERRSLRSECPSLGGGASRTESERELGAGRAAAEGWREAEGEGGEDTGLRKRKKGQIEIEVEEEEEEGLNALPPKAAQVFNPAVTILRSSCVPASPGESEAFWEAGTEKSPFLGPHGTPPDGYYQDWGGEGGAPKCGCDCVNRDGLKVGVSVFTAALLFPLLVWGGYVFLPFDAPLLDSAPLRLVYTLRCSVFAVVPIVLGWLVLGVCRLRLGAVKPRCEGEAEPREVGVHRRYVDDSVSLFLLYFLQLVVMAPYLSQNQLKLVPLLTIVFAFGRLVYWVAAALDSSVRGFGFGMSFLPTVAMLGANLYFIFSMDAMGTIFAMDTSAHSQDEQPPAPRQRFWG